MSSLSERDRNNIRAGVFVTISLIACLAVLLALTNIADGLFRATDQYIVTFPVSSGVPNLKKGSEVRVGGVVKGRVVKVIAPYGEGDAFRFIGVQFKLDRDIPLYENAMILVGVPIIGTDAWLDVPNVGNAANRLSPGHVIEGKPSVGMLTTMLGSENAARADEIVANVTKLSHFMAGIEDEYARRYVPVLEDIKQITGDARIVSTDFRANRWPSWSAAVSDVMTWATKATNDLDVAIAKGTDFLEESRLLVAENRPEVKKIVTHVEGATDRINRETIDKAHDFLASGQKAINAATPVLEMLREDYPKWSADIGSAMANANLASQQIKLSMIEVRRAPWKLIYRPTVDEVEHELLYDSVRTFALAAAELRTTAEAVKRILDDHKDKVSADQSVYHRLEQMLTKDLADYEKAQQDMLSILLADPKQ